MPKKGDKGFMFKVTREITGDSSGEIGFCHTAFLKLPDNGRTENKCF